MKKSVMALAMAFGVSSAFAQDLTSKKGEPILPEAGDWAISASANPFLNYIGMLGSSANTAPTFNFLTGNNVIVGKYFKDEKTAYRAGINLGFSTQTVSNNVLKDHVAAPKPGSVPDMVTDKQKTGNTGIGITVGIEKRKGKTRLQGYYGVEFAIYFAGSSTKNTYGNAMSDTTGNATSTTKFVPAGSTAGTAGKDSLMTSRVTQMKSGLNVQVGLRGFIGVEYFILPKMSLGGEFGWGLGISTWGAGQTTTEASYLNPSTTPPAGKPYLSSSNTTKNPGNAFQFIAGTDNKNSIFGPTGTIRMNFYF